MCSALGVWEREGADGDACDGTQYDAITARLAVARGSGLWRAEYHALPKMALTSGPWTVRSIAEVSAITRYQEPDVVRHVSQIKLQAESGDAPVPFPYAQFFVLNYTTTLVFDEPRRLAVAMSCSGQYEVRIIGEADGRQRHLSRNLASSMGHVFIERNERRVSPGFSQHCSLRKAHCGSISLLPRHLAHTGNDSGV